MLKTGTLALALTFAVFAFNSCKKVTQDQLINGLWKVKTMNIDTSSSNFLATHLPGYIDGNSGYIYKMDFELGGTILAFYVAHDSVTYVVPGTWTLTTYNKIYIKADDFLDGTFDIAKPGLKHWELTTDANHIKAYDGVNSSLDTTYTKLELYKI